MKKGSFLIALIVLTVILVVSGCSGSEVNKPSQTTTSLSTTETIDPDTNTTTATTKPTAATTTAATTKPTTATTTTATTAATTTVATTTAAMTGTTSPTETTMSPTQTTSVASTYDYNAALAQWAADVSASENAKVIDDGLCITRYEFEWVLFPYIQDGNVMGASCTWYNNSWYAGARAGEMERYLALSVYSASEPGTFMSVGELESMYPQFGS